jgi:ketopantoate reductase
MAPARTILILGASYGSLLATKLLLAGQNVSLVCLPEEAELINREGALVRLPVKGRERTVEIRSRKLGKLDAMTPAAADPRRFDLIALAMQEPQYGAGRSVSCWRGSLPPASPSCRS